MSSHNARMAKYRRGGMRRLSGKDVDPLSQQHQQHHLQWKHSLLVTIVLAFAGGYFVGTQESTPIRVSSLVNKLSVVMGTETETSADHMLGMVTKTRLELGRRLTQTEYGDFYGRLFDPIKVRDMYISSPNSKARVKRRLMIKILQKLVNPNERIDFVYVTAGDSVAAGHGNMFNQSYTAIIEDTVSASFRDLGINFVGRNYAMSWYTSAPELALCMEAVYGQDVDWLTWDFAFMESRHHEMMERVRLWSQRAIVHPQKPVLMFVDDSDSQRRPYIDEVETMGMPVMLMDVKSIDAIRSNVPPHVEGMSIAPALDYWICGDTIEGIEPCDDHLRFHLCEQVDEKSCLDQKFRTAPNCDSSQQSYHPGWKEHLFKGRLVGHRLLQLLEESLIELDALQHRHGRNNPLRAQYVLDMLLGQERRDAAAIDKSPIPSDYDVGERLLLRELGVRNLFRAPAVCHTALLPSQSRYLNYVTDHHHPSGAAAAGGNFSGGYDVGINKIKAYLGDGVMHLAYEMADRHRCDSPKIDHKDFFLIRHQDDWADLVAPSIQELRAYDRRNRHYHRRGIGHGGGGGGSGAGGGGGKKSKGGLATTPAHQGILIVCLQVCPMGRCTDDYVGFGRHFNGKIEMKVDGKDVKRVREFDGCQILENTSGLRWGPGREGSEGQYRLSFKLTAWQQGLDHTVKVSSVIVL